MRNCFTARQLATIQRWELKIYNTVLSQVVPRIYIQPSAATKSDFLII